MVNGVAALQNRHLTCGLEQVRKADRAILPHGVLYTCVRLPDLIGIATPASVAMEIVFAAAHSADATVPAMEDLLLVSLVIPELA